MKTLLSLAMAALVLAQPATAASKQEPSERSLDVPRKRDARLQQRSAAVAATMDDASVAAVTPEQVGDADSFGRKVKYLGVGSTTGVVLQDDCTDFDTSFGDRCIPLLAAPATTSFNIDGLGRIDLPGKASHSLLCFTLTPFGTVQFENPTATPRQARLRTTAMVTLESPVLSDPTLIDPTTGVPFAGEMTFPLTTNSEVRTLAAGAFESRNNPGSPRSCLGGLVSKQTLIGLGLTEKQANQFFKNPIGVRFGASGTAGSVTFLNYFYGMRIYGD